MNKLAGHVEVDETFIGGKARNMHAEEKKRKIQGRRGPMGKAIVAAVLERGGRVRTKVVDRRKKKDLQAFVREHVEPKSALYSDALKSYEGLDGEFLHQVIDHAEAYVDGQIHTNGLENFWSLLKRGIHGTYVSVEPYHLFRYLDEQAYRFNNRKDMNDGERFDLAVRQIVGKRLTWDSLTGKDEPSSVPVA
ncbi:MAG: IS1595 family transposase [Acidobacteriota bacterium]